MKGEETAELSTKVEQLSKKVDELTEKMEKLETTSSKIVQNSEKLIASADRQQSVDVAKNIISDPTGMLSKEMTNYFYRTVEKYETTKFRTWLATRSKPIVEQSVNSFVKSKIPQLNWYGASVTKLGANKFHYTAKSSFPFEIQTGVPVVGKIALARVVCEVNADVNAETRDVDNLKFHFNADQMNTSVLNDLEEDLTSTLKKRERTYKILSPIGRGLKRIKRALVNTPTFSVPLLLFTIGTVVFPGIPPAPQIFGALGLRLFNYYLLGINLMNVWHGLVNGVIIGAIVWFALKYDVLGKLKRKKPAAEAKSEGAAEETA